MVAEKTQKRFVPVNVDSVGSSIGYVICSYKDLVSLFGEPNNSSDGYKVSTSWNVKNTQTGRVVEIYDWKETELYDNHLMSVDAFRSLPRYKWCIGGARKFDAEELVEFLEEELGTDYSGCEDF